MHTDTLSKLFKIGKKTCPTKFWFPSVTFPVKLSFSRDPIIFSFSDPKTLQVIKLTKESLNVPLSGEIKVWLNLLLTINSNTFKLYWLLLRILLILGLKHREEKLLRMLVNYWMFSCELMRRQASSNSFSSPLFFMNHPLAIWWETTSAQKISLLSSFFTLS